MTDQYNPFKEPSRCSDIGYHLHRLHIALCDDGDIHEIGIKVSDQDDYDMLEIAFHVPNFKHGITSQEMELIEAALQTQSFRIRTQPHLIIYVPYQMTSLYYPFGNILEFKDYRDTFLRRRIECLHGHMFKSDEDNADSVPEEQLLVNSDTKTD